MGLYSIMTSFSIIMLRFIHVGSDSKESAYSAGDLGSIPEEGNGNPLHYSCLENLMDGGPWWATPHGVTESQTQPSN